MAYDALEDRHDVVTERHLGNKKYEIYTHQKVFHNKYLNIFEESSHIIIIPFQCDVHHCIENIVKILIDNGHLIRCGGQ